MLWDWGLGLYGVELSFLPSSVPEFLAELGQTMSLSLVKISPSLKCLGQMSQDCT